LAAHHDGYFLTYRHVRQTDIEQFMQRGVADPRFANMDAVSGRLAYLVKTAGEMACFTAPQDQREALIPVYKAMFREAISLARFPEQQKVARGICREMFWTQLRANSPGLSQEEERTQQARYLDRVEPACNVPIDDSKERAILLAIAKDDTASLRSAAREGFDFNRILDGSSPPIVMAATKGSSEMVAVLAAGGAKADVVGADGRTALDHMFTDFRGTPARRAAVIRALLEAGADANRPDIWGGPPIMRAADAEMLELLLKHGARIDQRVSCQGCGVQGGTVLHGNGDPAKARLAIQRGADVNAQNDSGDTPLMYVRSPEGVKVLLENGADPNIVPASGWTALMHVVQEYDGLPRGQYKEQMREVAEMLVAAGARLDIKNQHGVDVFYYTKDEAFKERLRALAAKR
jgi:ankyrin repeat protein